jgi:alkylation response protein AidB-like acyl-CoA dehydrogenase
MYQELDVHVTADHTAARTTAHDFAAKVLRPTAAALDRLPDPSDVVADRSPFWRALRQAYRLGYHRAMIPAAVGGPGLTGLEQHMLLEELGWGSADLATAIALAGFPFAIIASTGNRQLIDEFVRIFVDDVEARHIGCWAIAEPEHGSDTLLLGTPQFHDPRISGDVIARRDRDHWVLSGEKAAWVANGTIATHASRSIPGRGWQVAEPRSCRCTVGASGARSRSTRWASERSTRARCPSKTCVSTSGRCSPTRRSTSSSSTAPWPSRAGR